MSWFDTAGIANIAKSALKEAQRTIDKALDIKDEAVPAENSPIDTNSDDFFGSWGVSSTSSVQTGSLSKELKNNVVTTSPSKNKSSLWGSFTGSFFEPFPTTDNEQDASITQPKDSVDSLDDSIDLRAEHFTASKLVVQASDDSFEQEHHCLGQECPPKDKSQEEKAIDQPSNSNRLSVISIESDKKSESIEIINSASCLTTPDSEGLSSNSITRLTTESIEVLQNVTSPSSIEVLPFDGELSNITLTAGQKHSSLATPDNIEILPEDFEDPSIADDTVSCNSVSECTQNTAYESSKPKVIIEPTNMCQEVPITRAPSRCGMHLPLQHTSNIIDIPQEVQSSNDGEDSFSDRTIIAGDSAMESSSDTSTTTDSNTSSLYLKNMIADAMTEKVEPEPHYMDLTQSMLGEEEGPNMLQNLSISQLDMPPRETSPNSSESRSDMVKVGSDQTSGHTSGDEIETATSSDIEVISSPNGDSSSTQSRHSPAKITVSKLKNDGIDGLLCKMTMKKIVGHHRELSETSSISDDSEMDRILKRLAEVTEILELRENKLVETSRKLSEMQETNSKLQLQLDAVHDKQIHTAEMSQVTEKYTQRLSALEKKFQQAIRDKDVMRKQLDQCKEENAARMSKIEMNDILAEKDQIIKELREEGEKLSKQQLLHSNIIKKLRVKEKENEQTIKHLKESVEDLSSETERLKRSLTAKEEVERSQIEAIHQLTAKNKKSDYELSQVQSNYNDMQEKHDSIKKSLDVAKKELLDRMKTSNELHQREQLLESLENSKRLTESQNEEILNQLEDLRSKLRESEQELVEKENKHRSENATLIRRLENAESRNEELSQSISETSKPLVRQLESLQAAHNMKVASFERIEQDLSLKINELQNKLQNTFESSKTIKEECLSHKNKLSKLQINFDSTSRENEQLKLQLDQLKAEQMMTEQHTKKEYEELNEKFATERSNLIQLQKELESLQYNLNAERANHEKEKKKLQEKLQHENIRDKSDIMTRSSPSSLANVPGNQSPTLSIGRISVSESMHSSLWPDDNIDLNALSRCTNLLEMQVLQSSLKQRDGDVQQLQWELNRREHERTLLNTEISNLLTNVEELQTKVKKLTVLETELSELRQQYETLCQLYGEKVEENEELKLDLVDVKDMYKAQIDELLKQQKSALS